MITLISYVPFILLILGIVFTLFGDFSKDYINENMPLIFGVVLSIIVQEVLVFFVKEKN